jgi:Cu-Zn family superoxide dismutase
MRRRFSPSLRSIPSLCSLHSIPSLCSLRSIPSLCSLHSLSASTLTLALVAVGCAAPAGPATSVPEPGSDGGIRAASVELQSVGGVVGTLVFRTVDDGLEIDGEISGLTPGAHGFHIHEVGECTPPDFKSAGAHFNPTAAPHAAPTAAAHHLGDLGNIDADAEGKAKVHVVAALSLDPRSAASIMGKTVVVHASADDLSSQPAGNAGDRIACGVIAATED